MKLKKFFLACVLLLGLISFSSCLGQNTYAFKINNTTYTVSEVESAVTDVNKSLASSENSTTIDAKSLIQVVYASYIYEKYFEKRDFAVPSDNDIKNTVKTNLPNLNISNKNTLNYKFALYMSELNFLNNLSDKTTTKIEKTYTSDITKLQKKYPIDLNKRYGIISTDLSINIPTVPWIDVDSSTDELNQAQEGAQ